MGNVDDAAVATYPALAVEEEQSFRTRVMGRMCLGLPSRATVPPMENIASIGFRDLENDDDATAIVRASTECVALALTLRADGDLEVFMPLSACDELIAALSQARIFAKPS